MLNISGIHEGFVLDHIQAGMSLRIYHDLKLDKLDCTVAIIKNAKSNKMGKKDIIKVECPIEALDLDILGFIDHNITVNVIQGQERDQMQESALCDIDRAGTGSDFPSDGRGEGSLSLQIL